MSARYSGARSRASAFRPLVLGVLGFVAALPSCGGGSNGSGAGSTTSSLARGGPPRGGKSGASPSEIPVPADTIIPKKLNESVLSPRGSASLGVSDSGEAKYHVPIWVPPGRNGVQPELSLDYGSGASNSVYGVGWRLAGLPRITRCRKPSPPSGASAPITFGTGDSFCLDGEQLVAVSADGMTFHTFRDRAVQIVAHDPDSLGPTWFEERTKDGRIVTFGGTSDSQMGTYFDIGNLQKSARLSWGVSKIADRAGNFLKVTYTKSTGGDLLPSAIDYTGGAADPTTQRRVTFSYDQTRTDVDAPYISGAALSYPDRLTEIRTYGPNPTASGLLRTFTLRYKTSETSGRSLLQQIVECDQEPQVVIPPPPQPLPTNGPLCRVEAFDYTTTFRAFSANNTGITDVATKSSSGDTVAPQLVTLDVDGDGRDDLLYRTASAPDSYYHLRLSTGTGFGPDQQLSIIVAHDKPPYTNGPHPLDFDGDGHTDLLVSNGSPDYPGNYIYRATQQNGQWTLGPNPWQPDATIGYRQVEAADLNGDRFPDLVLSNPNSDWSNAPVYYAINQGGSFGSTLTPADFGRPSPAGHAFVDVNGDGRAELLTYDVAVPSKCSGGAGGTYTALGVGTLFPQPTGNGVTTWEPFPVSSWYCGTPSGSGGSCASDRDNCFNGCLGLGYLSPPWIVCDEVCQNKYQCSDQSVPHFQLPYFVDFNGDRLADLAQTDDSGNVKVFLSTGASVDSPTKVMSKWQTLAFRAMDWNLDGKGDLIQRDATTPDIGVFMLQHAGAPGSAGDSVRTDILPIGQVVADDQSDLQQLVVLDANGDGLDDVLLLQQGSLWLYTRVGDKPDLLKSAKGTLGVADTTVSYKPIVGADASTDCKLPIHCVTGGMWVVDTTTADNGVGGVNSYQHTFQNGRADLETWGFLGFKTHTIVDKQTGATTVRTFDLTPNTSGPVPYYPRVGLPVSEVTTTAFTTAGQSLTRTELRSTYYDIQGPGPFTVFPVLITEKVWDTTSTNVVENVTEHLVRQSGDAYGNVTLRFEQWPLDSVTQTTTITYQNRPDVWLVDLPRLVTVTNSANGESATRQTGYEFDGAGMIFRVTQDPGTDNGSGFDPLPAQPDGVQTLYTEFDRNPDGLPYRVTKEDRTDGTGQARFTTLQYDALERMFPVYTQDALGHAVQTAFHPGLGVLAVRVDENGVNTRWQYDTFGRARAEHPDTGDDRTVTYGGISSTASFGSVESKQLGGADIVSTLDSLGREVKRASSYRGDGQTVYVTTEYDVEGHVRAVSRPFFAGATPAKTVTTYDPLGRVAQVTNADGSTVTIAMAGELTVTQDPNGGIRGVMHDSLGHAIKSTEVITQGTGGGASHYAYTTSSYGPFGMLEKVTDTAGNVVQTIYDRRGRPRIELDPDAGGARKYVYDAFGEQTDLVRGGTFNGSDVTGGDLLHMTYDADGRMTTAAGPHWTRTQTWDTAANGVGKLAEVGMHTIAGAAIWTDFAYDSLSRLTSKTWGTRTTLTTALGYGYDAYSRPSTLTYPAVAGRAPLVARRNYSAGGQLLSVTNDATGAPYWTLESSDASETFTKAKFGNGVESTFAEDPSHPGWLSTITTVNGNAALQSLTYHWDGHARLRGRDDGVLGTKESFDYDAVQRLVHWTWSSPKASRAVRYDYDDIGNLKAQVVESGAGASVSYTYDSAHFGPHQPASTGAGAYAYDTHGNQSAAPGRTVVFNEFDLPQQITTPSGSWYFTYDGQLRRNIWSEPSGERVYAYDGVYEQRRMADGTVRHVFKVAANGPVAQVEDIVTAGSVTSETVTYLHVDHEGSVDTMTDENRKATPVKYDPFGARVSPSDPSKPVSTSPGDVRTGFTGQDHDDDGLSLVDMKGRVYDPLQHRFLSEDPVRPNPTHSQALSPYAYVFNNPLNFTDPTGYDALGGSSTFTIAGTGNQDNTFTLGDDNNSTDDFSWAQADYTPAPTNYVELANGNTTGGTEGFDGQSGPNVPDNIAGDIAPDYEWQGKTLTLGQCAGDAGCWRNYGPGDASPSQGISASSDDGGAWARQTGVPCYGWNCQTAVNVSIDVRSVTDPYVVVGVEGDAGLGVNLAPFAKTKGEQALVIGLDHEMGLYVASLTAYGVGRGAKVLGVGASGSIMKGAEVVLWSSTGVKVNETLSLVDGEVAGFGAGGWTSSDGARGGYVYRELGPLFIGGGLSNTPSQ